MDTSGENGEDPDRAADPELNLICRHALGVCGAQRISVWRHALSAPVISLHAGAKLDGKPDTPAALGRWARVALADLPPFAEVVRERRRVIVADAGAELGRFPQLSADLGMTSFCCYPLARGGEVLGVLVVEPAEAATVNDHQDQAVESLIASATASLAWMRAERRGAELELFLSLGEAAGTESLGEVLSLACQGLSKLLGVRRASIFLSQEGRLIPRMSRMADGSTDLEAWTKFRSPEVPLPLVDAVLASREPAQACESSSPLIAGWWAETFGLGAMLGVPVHDGERTIGVLALDTGTPRSFSPDHVRLAAGAATQLGWVIARAEARSLLAHQATHDPLTGLANRRAAEEYLSEATARAVRSGEELAVAFIDLDGFKEINDTWGHHRGDAVLAEVGRRLRQGRRKGDLAARLGGDEFAVVLHGVRRSAARAAAARIAGLVVDEPIEIGELRVHVGASIGIACFPAHAADAAELLRRADWAMYQAKQTHRNFQVYDPGQHRIQRRNSTLADELRRAVRRDELVLHYQPKVDLRTRTTEGVEALVRWAHPTMGMLAPDQFIPVAEAAGLIGAVTAWVVTHALAQVHAWAQAGLDVAVAVNFSASDIADPGLPERVAGWLAAAGVPPDRLVVEITEGVLVADVAQAAAVLEALRSYGVKISLDDFGAGYSSLSYLRHLPLDELKLDRSFLCRRGAITQDDPVLGAIVSLGHELGMTVVAEGVEEPGALPHLALLGCDYAQGFYFATPMPPAALAAWLNESRRATATGCAVPSPALSALGPSRDLMSQVRASCARAEGAP